MSHVRRQPSLRFQSVRPAIACAVLVSIAVSGCLDVQEGRGPGHRAQPLALSPQEELELGRECYQEILRGARVVQRGPQVDQVRRVSQRIAQAVQIEPLAREINLQITDSLFEWEYQVIESRQVNAFCLPG